MAIQTNFLDVEAGTPGVAASVVERMMLDLINEERAAAGVAPLVLDRRLNEASEDHSVWMADVGRLSHTGEGGSSPWARIREAGVTYSAAAENVAFQSLRGAPGIADDVENLHDALMASTRHRANLLSDRYEATGIGVEVENGRVYVTQTFADIRGEVVTDDASPAPAPAPTPAPAPAPTPDVADAYTAYLVDAATDRRIAEITDGGTVEIGSRSPSNLSIVIESTDDRTESVQLTVNGRTKMENFEPYALFGDSGGGADIAGGFVGLGERTLTFAAFDQDRGRGERLATETFEFTVVRSDAPTPPAPTPPAPPTPRDPFEDGLLTSYTSGGAREGNFNIDVAFNGGGWTRPIQEAFVRGAEFLSDVIIGDAAGRGGIDDFRIDVSLYSGERGGTLASAGPRGFLSSDGTTNQGVARFDLIDAQRLVDDLLDDVVVHEFFHALGSGIRGRGDEFATFTYNREFPELSGGNASRVPFEGGHLSEGLFRNELNTPSINGRNYLSETSVAVLEDLGYDTYLDNPFDRNDLSGPRPANTVTALDGPDGARAGLARADGGADAFADAFGHLGGCGCAGCCVETDAFADPASSDGMSARLADDGFVAASDDFV